VSERKVSAAPPDLDALLAKIENLTPPDQLRLAAALMEARRGDVAQPIVARVALGLDVAMRHRGTATPAGREAARR